MAPTILIFDGSTTPRHALERFFSRWGFDVETASDAEDCRAKIHLLEPDVLIVDLDLVWGDDGLLVVSDRERGPMQAPYLIVLGSAPPARLASRASVTARSCFRKPLRMGRLLARVETAIAARHLWEEVLE